MNKLANAKVKGVVYSVAANILDLDDIFWKILFDNKIDNKAFRLISRLRFTEALVMVAYCLSNLPSKFRVFCFDLGCTDEFKSSTKRPEPVSNEFFASEILALIQDNNMTMQAVGLSFDVCVQNGKYYFVAERKLNA